MPDLYIRCSSKFRIVLLILMISMDWSCISIRHNYIGPSVNYNPDLIPQKAPSIGEKLLDRQMSDSLLHIISELKRHGHHIPARELNQLYTVFGEQLNNDRYYQNLLQTGFFNPDSLNAIQYSATLELLSSAVNYEKSYQKNRLVRRSLNRGDSGNNIPKSVLRKSQNYLFAPSVRKTLEKQREKHKTTEIDSMFSLLPQTNTLKALHHKVFKHNDRIHDLLNNSVYAGSYVVGNTIGMFHEATDRKPKADQLFPYLRPYDLVVMKSSNHLTSQFIPGYFGHVGIWLGNELASQLDGKSSKNSDFAGSGMVEVLRSGTRISTLEEFTDGDIFLIIRPRKLIPKQKLSILTNLGKQLSKEYDFNFDIESSERIMCTELVYLAYDFVDWETRYTWSRFTLSPDDLVLTALEDSRFEFPVYLENNEAISHPSPKFLQSLVGQPDQLSNK